MSVKLLIADDDERNRKLLRHVLSNAYELYFSKDGNETINQVKRHSPDLILLDIIMPGLNGLEVCKSVRSNPSYDFTKIILLSGRALPEERVDGYKAGADDYLLKPYNIDELIAKIELHLKIKQTQDQFFLHSKMRMVPRQSDGDNEYTNSTNSVELNVEKIKKNLNWMFQLLHGYEMTESELAEGSESLEYVRSLKNRIDSASIRHDILQSLDEIQTNIDAQAEKFSDNDYALKNRGALSNR